MHVDINGYQSIVHINQVGKEFHLETFWPRALIFPAVPQKGGHTSIKIKFPVFLTFSLPTAYVVRGKVMFCLSVHGGRGVPQPGPAGGGGGTPPGGGGGDPSQVWRGYSRWGTPPQPGLTGGPWPGPAGGGYPSQVWWGGPKVLYPQQGWGTPGKVWQGVPEVGYPPPGRNGVSQVGYPPGRGYPPVQDNRWSTWYAAAGMPLAFTQEDCLVVYLLA